MGIIRHDGLEHYAHLFDAQGTSVVLMTTNVYMNTLVASVVAIAFIATGNHEIHSIRKAVHITHDFDGARAVPRTFNIDA
jgi:hypothetical protein